MLLYRTLGHQVIGNAVPISDAELLGWIMNVQRTHLGHLVSVGGSAISPSSGTRVLGSAGTVGGTIGGSTGVRTLGASGGAARVLGGGVSAGGARVLGGGVSAGAARVVGGGVSAGLVSPPAGGVMASVTDDVFNLVDRNHDGNISRSEFRSGIKGGLINRGPAAVLPGR